MKQKKITGGKRRRGSFKNNKKNEPLISVIMVCLNSQKYLAKSINSVLKQSYKSFELIIIDGGSTDDTLKILKKITIKLISGFLKKIRAILMQWIKELN